MNQPMEQPATTPLLLLLLLLLQTMEALLLDPPTVHFLIHVSRGTFSYTNLISDVASISVGVFDGKGGITEMDNIEINVPNPEKGGRSEVSLTFNYCSYEVYANGRGVIRMSMGGPGGPYYDPPALAEFVVTGTFLGSGDGCEITAMDSFLSASNEKDVVWRITVGGSTFS